MFVAHILWYAGQCGGALRTKAIDFPKFDGLVVEIIDDGSGIDEVLLPRIFEPRFSTRSTGAGLGLPIVQRLVNAWGGSVDVTSVSGEGTKVSIRLKRSDAGD